MAEIKGEKNTEGKENKLTEKLRENPWIVSSVIFGFVVLILLFMVLKPGLTGNVIAGSDAGSKLADYLNSMVGGGVEYISYEDLGNLYAVNVRYNGEEIPVYVTKDGNYFVQGVSPITGQATQQQNEQPTQEETPQEAPKSDKPKVELFVMTYCPYGTQAEKGLIPVFELLGNSIDSKIRFVHYFMHGDKEEQETYNQLCVREEQSASYLDYLSCFLEDGDSERCLTKTGIDKTKLNSCLSGKAKEYYQEDSELSKQYNVQGSPTLVINDVQVSSGRSSSGFLDTICSAFNTADAKCSQQLSSENPSPGFGYSAPATDNSGGSCS